MSIDYTHLRSVTIRHIIKALEKDGFFLVRHRGSHKHFKHQDGRRVNVTYYASSTTFPKGTLKQMIETQAKWIKDDLIRLNLLNQ